ncbi:exodeoxyribonuclease VII large subunit [Mucilaginibacter koreensis]
MAPVQYIRLSQLADWVQQTIDETLGSYAFWVLAEVTSHTYRAHNRHHYFELVEKDTGSSALTAKFSARAWQEGAEQIAEFEEATGQRFTNGIQVLVQVTIQYHPAYGLQLVLLDIDTSFTLGALEKQKQATLQRLLDENPEHIRLAGEVYETSNRLLKLNRVIQHIAVISSSTSAGFEDFQHTLQQNSFGYALRMDNYFAVVQGENNAKQLVDKLIEIYQSGIAYDAVVIIRGGGAQTDFLLFEQYAIGRAIARFPIPVITGIGHQKNETIADLMAHTAVKTPTKAAELIIAHNRAFEDDLLFLEQQLVIRAQQLVADKHNDLLQLKNQLVSNTVTYVTDRKEALNQQNQTITTQSRELLFEQRSALAGVNAKLVTGTQLQLLSSKHQLRFAHYTLKLASRYYLKHRKQQLDNMQQVTTLLSTENILKKGFALVKPLDDTIGLEPGSSIEITLAGQQLVATVTENKKQP